MIVAFIPAKQNSRRLKNKNMRIVNKKPLIEYSINYAKKSKLVNEIFVTSDSDKILKFAKKKKVGIIKRGLKLCGETPIKKVYKHAFNSIKNKKIKIIVGLQPDHPDRNLNLDKILYSFIKNKYSSSISFNSKHQKDGAYYIMTKNYLLKNKNNKVLKIYDDCTNIHSLNDLIKAKKNLKK